MALRHRLVVFLGSTLAVGVAALAARDRESEFVPRLSEGALVVNIVRLPGTSLEELLRDNTRMEKALRAAFPDEVEHVWSRCGMAEAATDPTGPVEAGMFITLKLRHQWRRARTQDKLVELVSGEFAVFPGQRLAFTQPVEQRVNEMISGVRGDVAVKLFGDDFDVLTAKANELRQVLESIEGRADVSVEQLTGQPLLEVRVKREAGQRRIMVQCNVRCRDLGGFVAEAQQRVAERVQLPPGRYPLE
jgi:cobalt-zinc-cadmium resistance protein CzcA